MGFTLSVESTHGPFLTKQNYIGMPFYYYLIKKTKLFLWWKFCGKKDGIEGIKGDIGMGERGHNRIGMWSLIFL